MVFKPSHILESYQELQKKELIPEFYSRPNESEFRQTVPVSMCNHNSSGDRNT